MKSILDMTAAQQGREIEQGNLDPVVLTQAYLDAAEDHPETHRIFTMLTPERALAEARAAQIRARCGQRLSPLDGVPISWKDLFDTAGHATEAGSALLRGRTPEVDAQVLRNASAAGLVCIGKTHMSELAFSGLGLNPVMQSPACINDPAAVSGGSSSGAAASVAFGLAAAAIGSDTGGSVRIPAAWNDLVGLKTTVGALPMGGVVPLCARFDSIGPLTKSVEDAALLFAALRGQNAFDLKGSHLRGKRLAVLQTAAFEDLRDAPRRGFEQALARLAEAGAVIEKVEIPAVSDALPLSPILYTCEAYGTWKDVIEAQPDLMFDEILKRFRGGAEFTAADYVSAWHTLDALRQSYAEKSAGYDAVLCPTAPILPPNAQRLLSDENYYVTENLLALRNTRIGNLLGLCAVTLPTGMPSCGIMLMAAPDQEERLLRLSLASEVALNS